ncbi:MAG: hypothetical protein LBR19_02750 [Bifidobacteriaceae bacterium]|nr:hypothetical protein [Bifidobacteriaceae bacterium]
MSVWGEATELLARGLPVRQVALRLQLPEDLVATVGRQALRAKGCPAPGGATPPPGLCGSCSLSAACGAVAVR